MNSHSIDIKAQQLSPGVDACVIIDAVITDLMSVWRSPVAAAAVPLDRRQRLAGRRLLLLF